MLTFLCFVVVVIRASEQECDGSGTVEGDFDILIMLGNPGVGKSTLLNCLLGRPAFASGVSRNGLPVTQTLQVETATNGKRFVDTPGYFDIQRREEAAVAIEQAFKLEPQARYRIVFVAHLESGRVVESDVTALRIMLEALKNVPDLQYGVLVNDVGPRKFQEVVGNETMRHEYAAFFAVSARQPASIFFYPTDVELVGKDGAVVPPRADFIAWLNNLPSPTVVREQVGKVDGTDWEKKFRDVSAQVASLEANNALLKQQIAATTNYIRQLQQARSKKGGGWLARLLPIVISVFF